MTGSLWIEQRSDHDLLLRVPTMLDKRVYGIGVIPRKSAAMSGTGMSADSSPLQLRFLRLGRPRLDELKDWVLDYTEEGRYPRLTVKPGALSTLLRRAQESGIVPDGLHHYFGYLAKPSPGETRLITSGRTPRPLR